MGAALKRITWVEVVVVLLICVTLVFVAVPAVLGQMARQKENAQAGEASNIALAMFNYNTDHRCYPSGPTSTAIFQQLYDQHYLGDGKPVRLTPVDVHWDVVVHDDGTGLSGADPASTPILISTGLGAQRFQVCPSISGSQLITVVRLDQSTAFGRPTSSSLSPAPNPTGRWYKTVTP